MMGSAVGRVGELRLGFVERQQKTILTEKYSRPPLQVMRAIPDDAGCLCIYLLSPSGGVVQHDRYSIVITAGARTHSLLTTPSATRIYRMPTGHASQHVHACVEPGAILEFVPEANILFAEADFEQTMDVTIEGDGLMVVQDSVMPGRLARGESWQFRRYRNRLRVRDEKGWLLYDASTIEPTRTSVHRLGTMDGFSCWGSLFIIGDLAARGIDSVAFCQFFTEQWNRTDCSVGISLLPRKGIGVRILSHHLEAIYAVFSDVRKGLRTWLGLSAATLRK